MIERAEVRNFILTMSAYIPQELLFTEVLIRLPLKSLARFRCVSKSWKAQIDNLQFVKTHYKRTKDSDSAEVRILIGGSYCGTYKLFSINIHDILSFDLGEVCGRTKEIKISRKLKHGIYELHDFYGCQIIGSCYGLICLGLLSGTAPLALTFMNPLTRKKWDLPWFPRHYPGGTSHHYGFGYNEVTDDYILVVLAENPSKDVMIYSLNSNSWRVLDSPFEGATAFDDQLRGVFTGKALHWVMRDWDSMEIFVVAFDLQTEQFYCMMLPEYPGGSIHWKVCLGSSGGGLSAVFISMYPTYVVDMWVMRKYGDEESWFKYTLKLPICRLYTSVIPIALTKGYHHQILLQIMFESFNEGSNSLLLYNLRRRSATFLRNPVALSTLAACVCSGSLLLPSGGGARRRRKKPSFRWSWPSLNITQSLENINLLDPTGRSADEG